MLLPFVMAGTAKSYAPPLPRFETLFRTLSFMPAIQDWRDELAAVEEPFDRICLDRYLLIVQSLKRLGLFDCTVLDLGCASGFFSFCLAVSMTSRVTAVDDERAGNSTSLKPLIEARDQYELKHLDIRNESMESLLASEAGRSSWDAVLCLGVLHHLHTGYGDDPANGKIDRKQMRLVYERLGAVTGQVLYLDVDSQRLNTEELFRELQELGNFGEPRPLGLSCSAPGYPRVIWELLRNG